MTTTISSSSITLQFHECCAPFERGCDSLDEFKSKRLTTFEACLIPPESAQTTMQAFNKQGSFFRLPTEFQHLKRITKPKSSSSNDSSSSDSAAATSTSTATSKLLLILLCPTSSIPKEEHNKDQFLSQKLHSEITMMNSGSNNSITFQTIPVPLYPQTPKEWVFAHAVWPLSMPRLHRTVRDTDPSLLSENSKRAALAGYENNLKMMTSSSTNEETEKNSNTKSSPTDDDDDEVKMVASVVNLADCKVLASCVKTYRNVRKLKRKNPLALPYSFGKAEVENKNQIDDGNQEEEKENEKGDDEDDITHIHKHVTFEVLRQVSQLQAQLNSGGYLCNDLALVTKHEPCVMCSMALVHSRISMVFYEEENRVHGGLGGGHDCSSNNTHQEEQDEPPQQQQQKEYHFVNRIPSLNHRFPAYRIEKVGNNE